MIPVYILKQKYNTPYGSIEAGTESIYEKGYFVFPYQGKAKGANGWNGAAFICSGKDLHKIAPDWYELKNDTCE